MWIFTPDSTCTSCTDKLPPVSGKESYKDNSNNPYLFPNPNNGNFEIRNTLGFTEVTIYKITSELIFRKQISSSTINIDIDTPGMYTVQLLSPKTKRTLKLIITK
jgi:hypothetical protein